MFNNKSNVQIGHFYFTQNRTFLFRLDNLIRGFDKFLKIGYIDVFRYFYPRKIQYTWWTYRFGARARNIGWRIDYFLASPRLIKKIKKVFILDKILGSDHCPVGVEIDV